MSRATNEVISSFSSPFSSNTANEELKWNSNKLSRITDDSLSLHFIRFKATRSSSLRNLQNYSLLSLYTISCTTLLPTSWKVWNLVRGRFHLHSLHMHSSDDLGVSTAAIFKFILMVLSFKLLEFDSYFLFGWKTILCGVGSDSK